MQRSRVRGTRLEKVSRGVLYRATKSDVLINYDNCETFKIAKEELHEKTKYEVENKFRD